MHAGKRRAAIALLVIGMAVVAASRAGWIGDARNTRASSSSLPFLPSDSPSLGRRGIPDSLPASLTLSGDVVESIQPSAGLIVHVGSTVSQSTVSTQTYSVTIAGNNPDDMVWIEVQGGAAYYATMLGSYRTLARHAGIDGVVRVPGLDRLRISPITTALYFFTKRALGGSLPTSDVEYERVISTLDGSEVGMAATVLDLFGSGARALPTGYQNGYALLGNQPDYSSFVSTSPSNGLIPEYTAYMAVAPSAPIGAYQLTQNILMSGPRVLNDVQLLDNRSTQVMSPIPAGVSISTSPSRRNSAFSPQLLPSGELKVTPAGEISSDRFVCDFAACQASGDPSPQKHYVLQSENYRQLFTGDKYSLWVGLSRNLVTYPGYPNEPSHFETSTNVWAVSNLNAMAIGFRSVELSGPRALPVFCKQGFLVVCEYALHQFQSGGTGWTADVGVKIDTTMMPQSGSAGEGFQWSVTGAPKGGFSDSAGRLQIATSTALTTYWRVDSGDAATDFLVYVARAQDGADTLTLAGQTALIDGSIPAGFADIDPVGTWRYATFEWAQPYVFDGVNYQAPITTRFTRNADGTEIQKQWRTDNPDDPDYKLDIFSGWRLLNGRLYDTRYKADKAHIGGLDYSSCALAYASGATLCAPRRVPYFRPLAAVGNRLYGIEELYLNTTSFNTTSSYSPPYTFSRFSRPTYYEKLNP